MDKLVKKYTDKVRANTQIPSELFDRFGVKKGLREVTGKGVMAGLTSISNVQSFDEKGREMPGLLEYRSYDVKAMINDFKASNRFGFEEVAYLLLFGELPTQAALQEFKDELAKRRDLPKAFVRDVILPNPSGDLMNAMSKGLLTLATHDVNSQDISLENVLDQSLDLIAKFPLLAIYSYHAFNHARQFNSLHIHYPDPNLTTAENILRLLRPDASYTDLEAKVLDVALILHMEHGGGNNSSFTTHVVTSSGTDTYASVVASLSSLKGPKHGGANIKASHMLEDIKQNIKDPTDEAEIEAYLEKILSKEAFDKQGLIYGIGHAIYTISDPRFEVFKSYVADLAAEKNLLEEFKLYEKVEQISPRLIASKTKTYKTICPNVDFYSGFVYRILGIPEELYTPLFAIARIVGWSAHRLEELINMNKIIRPAYASIAPSKEYQPLKEREALNNE